MDKSSHIDALSNSLDQERSSLHDLERVAATDLDSLRPLRTTSDGDDSDNDDKEEVSMRTIDQDFNDNHNGMDLSVTFDASDAGPGFDSADTILAGASPNLPQKFHLPSGAMGGFDFDQPENGLLGYGYRGTAYSNLAELRELLSQWSEELDADLEEDLRKQKQNIASKLEDDLDNLREDLRRRHASVQQELLEEESQRIRQENAAALEEISVQFQETKDRITKDAKKMYDEKSEQASLINAKLLQEKERAVEKLEFSHRLQVKELTVRTQTCPNHASLLLTSRLISSFIWLRLNTIRRTTCPRRRAWKNLFVHAATML